VLSIATGHSVRYLTDAVAKGRENYYTGAVAAGEPPGRWYGAGAAALGLEGEVDADLMEAIHTRLLDPRDPAAHARETWDDAAPLAAGHRKYRSADEVYAGLLEANPDAGPEQRAELRSQAERSARQAVSFIDVTARGPRHHEGDRSPGGGCSRVADGTIDGDERALSSESDQPSVGTPLQRRSMRSACGPRSL
jgi:hypothetical protein